MSDIKLKSAIAFFDFDGTITRKDSMWLFLRFFSGEFTFFKKIILLLPVLALFKLGLTSSKNTKEAVFKKFFKNCELDLFEERCKLFTEKILINHIRSSALERIAWHKENEHQIVVVSASPKNWLKYWCEYENIDLIATELKVNNHKLTGQILGENCKGVQKVIRIKQVYELDSFEQIFAYGDSRGDKEMLEMTRKAFYRVFD